ncbi:hypothetical protein [Adonisia turfae]|nr:hypothetical protein [Adonisia turfae]
MNNTRFSDLIEITRNGQTMRITPAQLQPGDALLVNGQLRIVEGYNPQRGWALRAPRFEEYEIENPAVRVGLGMLDGLAKFLS